ncbi:hypothetical protein [Emcibacter sp. SYSU 3D8]|uniref:hypothetical protein n=1 Tax=Emcibacter sp. SYSU 3D8 TaxID=3133969 RepID=UPI0031FEDEEF
MRQVLAGILALGLLLDSATGETLAPTVTPEDFPPLDEMYYEEANAWSWPIIHRRCAGVYLLTQWMSEDDPTVTNRFIDRGEFHVYAAARHLSRDVQLDFERALDDTMSSANQMGMRYMELAEPIIEAGGDPLRDSMIAADLTFCDQIRRPDTFEQ